MTGTKPACGGFPSPAGRPTVGVLTLTQLRLRVRIRYRDGFRANGQRKLAPA
ncbi:MAG: hypothetical protein ABSC93_10030 [Bryobacteraceae bacterium]